MSSIVKHASGPPPPCQRSIAIRKFQLPKEEKLPSPSSGLRQSRVPRGCGRLAERTPGLLDGVDHARRGGEHDGQRSHQSTQEGFSFRRHRQFLSLDSRQFANRKEHNTNNTNRKILCVAVIPDQVRHDGLREAGNRPAVPGKTGRSIATPTPVSHIAAVQEREHCMESWHGTTILAVRKNGRAVIAGDGQVTLGQTVIKPNARKVRRLGDGSVIGGFAGATADAFTLFERLERKLEQHHGQLMRAAVELAKDWRTDKYLRNLEAMMIVADKEVTLVLTGNGDVLEPGSGVAAIGSGGNFALAAATALLDYEEDAETLARKAMGIAAEICVYTNGNLTVESLESAA
jgi:ATP-dependent HslUV protease subunit HslV